MRSLLTAVLLLGVLTPTAQAGLLSAQGVAVLDATALPRTSFTNSERVILQQKVYNGIASTNRIVFSFILLSPSGAQVLRNSGNAVPGSVGNAASQLSGLAISQFYQGPGIYTFKAAASLDGQTLEQQATFTVSSPNILLIYPPNGAQGIADIPLTFRWSSSGASTYRVTVGNNPSFYNSLFSQQTTGTENFLSYPENPSDPRQRLGAGQLYYWKVEGLDISGLKVAESASPFSFTVQTAALTKDMTVSFLEVSAGIGADLPFKVTVKNQGGTAESNVPLKFSLGGLAAPNTPLIMPSLMPGESRDYSFTASVPSDQNQSLAIACVEFSDDNLSNNCKTLMVNKPPGSGTGSPIFNRSGPLTSEQIWQAIRELMRERGILDTLSDYKLIGMEGQLNSEELMTLLDSLRKGQANATLTGPPIAASPSPRSTTPTPQTARLPAAANPPESSQLPAKPAEMTELGSQWAGFTLTESPKTKGFVITDSRDWKKVWRRLQRGGNAPEIDLEKFMVVGVIAGKTDRVDHIEIASIEMQLTGLTVKYRLAVQERLLEPGGLRRAALRSAVPYYMRIVAKSSAPVKFQAVE